MVPSNNAADSSGFDLLRMPIFGKILSHRQTRTLLQIPLLLLSAAMVLHGLFGPSLAPKNLATILSWVHFRGALVLVMLAAGNFFCYACPLMLVRRTARRFIHPKRNWPRMLRNKWLSLGLFILILFTYELFDLWGSPWWTAWLIVAYFAGALLIDCIFKHASFCKYVCPIGQFNFVASTISPLEVKVRDQTICLDCHTKDCIRGRRDPAHSLKVIQRGCELSLFQPAKIGNMDCTFCLDCVYACPHDNVGIIGRLPAGELMTDPPRSGVGYFSRRKDLSALVTVFTFGALLNAFGMVSPVYALQRWLAGILHLQREAPGLGLIFIFFLVVEPVLLFALAAWLSKKLGGAREAIIPLSMRHAYGLAPLGFAVWLSHYSFHFLTGFLTFIPVTQKALANIGWGFLGEADWSLVGLPLSAAYPLELGFLGLGLCGSLLVSYRLTEEDSAQCTVRAYAPWAALCVLLWVAAMWLMSQPMEMRGTIFGG
ncbi:MAG: FesM [Blastocatellia bacterium]|nr:FesM [Blastocatellia bacterium]